MTRALQISCCFVALLWARIIVGQTDFPGSNAEYWPTRSPIHSISVSPDEKSCITGCENGEIILWNIKKREKVQVFSGHSKSVDSIKFFDNKRFLSASLDGTVREWTLDNTSAIAVVAAPTNDYVNNLRLISDRRWLAGSFRKIIEAVDNKKADVFLNGVGAIGVFDVSSDKKKLAAGSRPFHIFEYDLETRTQTRTIELQKTKEDGTGLPGRVASIQYSRDSSNLLVLTDSRHHCCCMVVNPKTDSCRLIDVSEEGARRLAVYSPSERYILLVGFDISIFDSASGKLVEKLSAPPPGYEPKPAYFTSIAAIEGKSSLKLFAGTTDGKIFESLTKFQ